MKLYVLSNYKNRELSFSKGDVIEDISPEFAAFLKADSPGSFSEKGFKEPPKNKMISSPDYSKMTVKQLRARLKGEGLSGEGNKGTLIERLQNG